MSLSGTLCSGAQSYSHGKAEITREMQQSQESHKLWQPILHTKPSHRPHFMQQTVNSSSRGRVKTSARKRAKISFPSGYRSAAPDTDPAIITTIWREVATSNMGPRDPTQSSRGKRRDKVSPIGSVAPPSAWTLGQPREETSTASEASTTRTRKDVAAKITDADFAKTILKSCGIEIQNRGVNKDLCKVFRIQEQNLPMDSKDRLKSYREMHTLSIWLDPNEEQIRAEYKARQVQNSNEAEFSAYALGAFFLDEPRSPWLQEEPGSECWRSMRMLQFVQKPAEDNQWYAPPFLQPSEKRYLWDIRPDCVYYVSLQAYRSGFRPSVRNHVAVVQGRAFSPYLTIEFKKDEETLTAAQHQVTAFSAMTLYNRYLLKKCALEMSRKTWSGEDKDQMRHYGISFTGSTWKLWITMPKNFETWDGCVASTIYSGDCCTVAGVRQLINIINDIHYWGLEIHGKSCKKDIAIKIASEPDADKNDITLVEDVLHNTTALKD
ncbi:MAG: hypothetical protein Q9157_007921 [Trypethelium eluteriae]